MEFDNTLEVPLPPDEAWKVLLDIKRVAACIPGAELTEVVDDTTYKGKVAVRLGPVALSLAGHATLEEIDEGGRRVRVKTHGADPKGRGGADSVIGAKSGSESMPVHHPAPTVAAAATTRSETTRRRARRRRGRRSGGMPDIALYVSA